MKKTVSIVLILVVVICVSIFLFITHKKTPISVQQKAPQKPVDEISSGITFYSTRPLSTYVIDDYLLLNKIQQMTHQVTPSTLDSLKQVFKANPFRRLVNKNDFTEDIAFHQEKDSKTGLGYYGIDNVQGEFQSYDTIFLKALYCDKTGYNDADFALLSQLKHNNGDYYDTHYLFGLILLQENNCYEQSTIASEIDKTTQIIESAEGKDTSFSDLYAERIVMLYWAGSGDSVKSSWIEKIKDSSTKNDGWQYSGNTHSINHTTGFSILSLLYYKDNKPHQPIY